MPRAFVVPTTVSALLRLDGLYLSQTCSRVFTRRKKWPASTRLLSPPKDVSQIKRELDRLNARLGLCDGSEITAALADWYD
jgi:hypothetical protein